MRTLKMTLIFPIVIIAFSFPHILCKAPVKSSEEFQFPKIDWIDPAVYNEIKKTCRAHWDLNNMIEDTFGIKITEGIEYAIDCDGYLEEKLYRFWILVDENGNWINDGRTLKNP